METLLVREVPPLCQQKKRFFSSRSIGIKNADRFMWDTYIRSLKNVHVCLREIEDVMIINNVSFGFYIHDHRYIHMNIDILNKEALWWWKRMWKLI